MPREEIDDDFDCTYDGENIQLNNNNNDEIIQNEEEISKMLMEL